VWLVRHTNRTCNFGSPFLPNRTCPSYLLLSSPLLPPLSPLPYPPYFHTTMLVTRLLRPCSRIALAPSSLFARTLTSVASTSKLTPPVQLSFNDIPQPSSVQPARCQPIVIMHGLFGSKQNWKALSKAMASRLNTRVVTLVRTPGPCLSASNCSVAFVLNKYRVRSSPYEEGVLVESRMQGNRSLTPVMLTSHPKRCPIFPDRSFLFFCFFFNCAGSSQSRREWPRRRT